MAYRTRKCASRRRKTSRHGIRGGGANNWPHYGNSGFRGGRRKTSRRGIRGGYEMCSGIPLPK